MSSKITNLITTSNFLKKYEVLTYAVHNCLAWQVNGELYQSAYENNCCVRNYEVG